MDFLNKEVTIPAGPLTVEGILVIPPNAKALVLFAHDSCCNHLSPRNRQVTEYLNASGFATLLCDLLSPEEHVRDIVTAEFRFDAPRLAKRLIAIMDWIQQQADLRTLPLCLFGTSTSSTAALMAAAERPKLVKALVSRGERHDCAHDALDHAPAPALLLVGAEDGAVRKLNEQAAASYYFSESGNP